MGKYTPLFIDESRRHLQVIEASLRTAGEGREGGAHFAEGCRLAHLIKGMALFEEQKGVADLASALEEGFDRAAEGAEEALVERLRRGVELLGVLIDEVESDGTSRSDPGPLVAEIVVRTGG